MTDSRIPLALNFGPDGSIRGFRQAPDLYVTSINAASALFTGPLSAATFYASSFTISSLTVTSLNADVLNVALFEPDNIITAYMSATNFDADTFSVQELSLTSLSATNSYLPNVQVTAIVGDSINVTNVTGINGSLNVIQNLSFFGNEAAIAALTATTSRLISTNIVTGNIGTLNTTSLNAVSFNPANITTTNLTAVSLTTTSLNAVSFNPASISTTNLSAVNFSSNSITAVNLNSTNFNPANISTTNLTATNFTNTNTTSVNSLVTTLNATNGIISYIQNIQTETTLVNTLDLTATNSRLRYPLILSGTANNLSGSNLNFTSVTAVGLVGTDANFTNVTATNLNAVSFNPASISTTNLTGTNATFGSVTATNLNTANFNPATINSTNVTATNGSFTNATALTIQGGTSRYTNIYGTDAVITNTSSTTNQADQAWIKDLSSTRDFAINSSGLTLDTWQIRFPSVTSHDGNQSPYSAVLLVSANTYQGNAYYANGPNPQFAGKDALGIRNLDTAFLYVGDAVFVGGPVFGIAGRHPSNPGYAGGFNPNDFSGTPPPISSTYYVVTSIAGGAGTNMSKGILFHSGDDETDYIVGYVDHITTSIPVAPVLDSPTVDTVFGVYNKETILRSFVNYAGPTAPIQGNLTVLGILSSINLTGTNILATNVTATNLTVTNNIVVGGTVDGVDISTANTTLNNHLTSASVHFTAESLTSTYSVTSHNHALSGLTDTQITATPVNNSVLTWSATKWIPSSITFPTVITDHGGLGGLGDDDHPQYVLTSINSTLSSDVSNHIASASVHFTVGSIDHGSIAGLEDNDHPQYVLSSTNSNLSSQVSNHVASASVHFTAESLTSTYSVTSHNHALSGLTDTQITATPINNAVLTWSATKWVPSSVIFPTVITDHGLLNGLTDNDHPQYVLTSVNNTLSSNVESHIADTTIHFTVGSIDHGSIVGLADNDHPQYVLTSVNNTLSSLVTDHLASSVVHFTAESLTSLYSVTSHNHALSGLTDIQITATPTNGDSLVWSSTKWIASSVAGGAGVTDHGALTGLLDDDHTQYILVDGTRAFTANVSGITPTLSAHLSNKGYVDAKQWSTNSLSGGTLTVSRGGLGNSSFSTNDLIFFDGSKFDAIPIGSDNDVLKVVGGVWTTAPDDTAGGSTISATNVTSVNMSALNLTAVNFRVNGSTLGTAAFLNEGLGAGDLITVLNAVLNFSPAGHTHNAVDIIAGTLARDVNNTNTSAVNLAVTSITTGGGFTNVVSGVAPTDSTHLVTRGYLDSWISSIKLADDVSAGNTTVIPVTGMGFYVEANSDYFYNFFCHIKTSVTATGVRIGVSGPGGTTYVSHKTEVPTSNTALVNRFDGAFGTNNALGTALPTNTLTYLAKGEGLIRTGGSPGATVVCPTLAAENTATVGLLAGSVMLVRKI